MNRLLTVTTFGLHVLFWPALAQARTWTDSTGAYELEAELISFNDKTAVLKRADHHLVAYPIDKLSDGDREYLKSKEAGELTKELAENLQTWTLRDGTKVSGRIVDYAQREMTIQRRRGRIHVNDRLIGNLPEFYRQLVPKVVAHFEELPSADARSLEAWVVRQRGERRTFPLEGVVIESENGDEYALPFFLFAEADLKLLKPGWERWKEAHDSQRYDAEQDLAYLLESLAVARSRDAQIEREIAMMQLQLQAVQTGLTSLWEVTLLPVAGPARPPQWVVVPARDSRQATVAALQSNPGYQAGPVRRVTRR